jgi:hypothetical protein
VPRLTPAMPPSYSASTNRRQALAAASRSASICRTVFGITGVPERLKIPLDLSKPPVSYAARALTVVRRTPVVKVFGGTTGFVVNYGPDKAVRLRGQPFLANPETVQRSGWLVAKKSDWLKLTIFHLDFCLRRKARRDPAARP